MDDLPPLLVERDVNGEWMTFLFVIFFMISIRIIFIRLLTSYVFLYIQSRINILGTIMIADLETEDLLEGNLNFIIMIKYYAKGIIYITSIYVIFFMFLGQFRQPQVQCESERDILLTVAITTIVNFIFFGFIMVAKYWICNSCDGCGRENL